MRIWLVIPSSCITLHTHLVQNADPNLRLLNSFLDYLKVEKGLAPLTVSAYRSDLEQYSQFLLKRMRCGLRTPPALMPMRHECGRWPPTRSS